MKNSMIKHFLSLRKNGGKLTKKTLNENEVVLCDGFFSSFKIEIRWF